MIINEEDKTLIADVMKEELQNNGIVKGGLTNAHKTGIVNSLVASGLDLESTNMILAGVVSCF